jgi:hypothetical protein
MPVKLNIRKLHPLFVGEVLDIDLQTPMRTRITELFGIKHPIHDDGRLGASPVRTALP